MEEIKEQQNQIKIKEEEYKDYTIMLDSLDNKEIESVLMTDAYYQMLSEENEDHTNFICSVYVRLLRKLARTKPRS